MAHQRPRQLPKPNFQSHFPAPKVVEMHHKNNHNAFTPGWKRPKKQEKQRPVSNPPEMPAVTNTSESKTTPTKTSEEEYHPYIIPGFDLLIGDPDILTPDSDTKRKADYLLIPTTYLDSLYQFYNEISSRGEAAQKIVHTLGRIRLQINESRKNGNFAAEELECFLCQNGMRIAFCDGNHHLPSARLQAVDLAKRLLSVSSNRGRIAIMTGSDKLIASAAMADIDVAIANPEIYRGRRKIILPTELEGLWQKDSHGNRFIPADICKDLASDEPLRLNEYVELKFETRASSRRGWYDNVGKFNGYGITPLDYGKFSHPAYHHIRPLNVGQAMLMDALAAPTDEIATVIVNGTFGTGKTFMTVAAAMAGTDSKTYEKIYVCPSDGSLGKAKGFAPGTPQEKAMADARPIISAIREVLRLKDDAPSRKAIEEITEDISSRRAAREKHKAKKILQAEQHLSLDKKADLYIRDHFEFVSLIAIQGESINRGFLILDEFENTERFQARGTLSRAGFNTKTVAMGDPYQINNPHLNINSNGLSYAASKFGGQPLIAVVSLEPHEVERSEVAAIIANTI